MPSASKSAFESDAKFDADGALPSRTHVLKITHRSRGGVTVAGEREEARRGKKEEGERGEQRGEREREEGEGEGGERRRKEKRRRRRKRGKEKCAESKGHGLEGRKVSSRGAEAKRRAERRERRDRVCVCVCVACAWRVARLRWGACVCTQAAHFGKWTNSTTISATTLGRSSSSTFRRGMGAKPAPQRGLLRAHAFRPARARTHQFARPSI